AAPLPPGQYGRAAALHRLDAGASLDPRADALEAGCDVGIVGAALCRHLAIRSLFLLLSEWDLGLQSDGLAIAVRVRRLVRARRRAAHGAHPVVAHHPVGLRDLSHCRVLRHADMVCPADEPLAAAPA